MKHTKPRILILEESPAKAKKRPSTSAKQQKFGIAIVASTRVYGNTPLLPGGRSYFRLQAVRLDGLALKETLAYDESAFIL